MTKKRASIGMAVIVTTASIIFLVFKGWKKEKTQNIGYNSWDLIDEIEERDIAWG